MCRVDILTRKHVRTKETEMKDIGEPKALAMMFTMADEHLNN